MQYIYGINDDYKKYYGSLETHIICNKKQVIFESCYISNFNAEKIINELSEKFKIGGRIKCKEQNSKILFNVRFKLNNNFNEEDLKFVINQLNKYYDNI
ncbi:MAG: hypothetical protein LBM96_06040 [Methanobrevibacter sp.]|jgi:hypothetical protein|nr:hypothetical protein [Candidatus Methanoflexus mossambicus]